MNPNLPQRKVVAGGATGALSSIVVWLLQQQGVDVPPEIAVAITTLLSFIVSYWVPSAPGVSNAA
jgi:putative flippase GtrA